MLKRLLLALTTASAALVCTAAVAEDFPSHPVHIMVPWAPGGNVDITARTLQQAFSEALGQPSRARTDGAPGRPETGARAL